MNAKSIAAVLTVCLLALSVACGPKHTVTPLEKGIELYEARSIDEAKAQFEPLAAADPADPTATAYLGRIALANEQPDDAVEWFKKAVALDETNADFHFWLAQAYAVKLQSASFMEQGAIAPAFKEELDKAVELNPQHVMARIYLASFYLNAPPIAGGSTAKAAEQAEEILKLDPKQGHQLMAQVLMKKNDFDGAEKEYLAVVEMDPKDVDVLFGLGRFYQEAKRWDKAFEAFEKILAIDPKHMNSLYQMGRTAVFSGENVDRAVECLKTFLTMEPGEGIPTLGNAHWRLGMLYEKQGLKDMARKEYEEALELDPEDQNAKKALENL